MIIYKYEKQDKLDLSCAALAYEAEVKPLEKKFVDRVVASFDHDGLYPVQSILVSTVVNKNDDVFAPDQVWKARHTPINKPSNIEHDEKQLVGHCISSWAVDEQMNLIPEETIVDKLPDLYHLVTSSVIYTSWQDDKQLEKVRELISAIENNNMFVSMECRFKDFDYLLETANELKLVSRNNETSWLTKYLRSYGGQGKYKQYQVYRYLKDFTFSAFGFVKKPANPASVIFNGMRNLSFKTAKASNMDEKLELEKKNLESTVAELKAKLEVEKLKNEDLVKSLESVKAEVVSYKTQVETKTSENKKLNDDLTGAKEVIDASKKNLDKLNEDYSKAQEKIVAFENEKRKLARLAKLAEADMDQTKAGELVDKFASASDEIFDSLVSAFPKKKAAVASTDLKVESETKPNTQALETKPEETRAKLREWFSKV